MSNSIRIPFNFSDDINHDASVSEISEVQTICFAHFWSLVPGYSGLDADPLYTIEVSNDNILFNPYSPLTEDAAIDQGFDDTHTNFIYWRINYKANGNTTGNVKFELILKK